MMRHKEVERLLDEHGIPGASRHEQRLLVRRAASLALQELSRALTAPAYTRRGLRSKLGHEQAVEGIEVGLLESLPAEERGA